MARIAKNPPAADPPAPEALWGALFLLVAAMAVYANSFSVPFVLDDRLLVAQNPSIRHLWPLWDVVSPPHAHLRELDRSYASRPILNLSFALNYAVGGLAVGGYHAVNLLIHVLAGFTLFGIARRTFRQPSLRDRFGAAAAPLAFAVALLWLLHPLQTESVTYILQRAESLTGLFYLLTLYGVIRGAEGSPARRGWYALSLTACWLGMGCKEFMASAPLMTLLYDRTLIAGSFGEAWRRRWKIYLGLAASWFLLGYLVFDSARSGEDNGFGLGVSWRDYGLTQLAAVPHYLRLALWPHPLVFDYGKVLVTDPARVVPGAVLIALLAGGTVFAFCRRWAVGWVGAWFFLILAASSSVFPVVGQTMAEHRMYLPLAALAGLGVAGAYRAIGAWTALPCLALAAIWGTLTWQRNHDYRSEIALWELTAAQRPENARAQHNLGYSLLLGGRPEEALAPLRKAAGLDPAAPETQNDLGYALAATGRSEEALNHYREALRLNPDFPEARRNLGNALLRLGRQEEAMEQFQAAPPSPPSPALPKGEAGAHYDRGVVLARAGRMEEAAVEFRESARLAPDSSAARSGLGGAYLQMGKGSEAVAELQEALRLAPGNAEAHDNLGAAWLRLGKYSEAAAEFEEALRLRPDYVRAYRGLQRAKALREGR